MRRGLSERFWYSLENSNILYTQFVVAGLKHTLYNYQSPLRTLRNTQVQRLPCVVKTPHGVTSPIMHPGECCERALWEGWWWMCVPGQAESMVTSLISCGHFLTRSPLCAVRCRKVIFTYHLSWAAPTVCTARCWAPYVYIYILHFFRYENYSCSSLKSHAPAVLKVTCIIRGPESPIKGLSVQLYSGVITALDRTPSGLSPGLWGTASCTAITLHGQGANRPKKKKPNTFMYIPTCKYKNKHTHTHSKEMSVLARRRRIKQTFWVYYEPLCA